MSDYRKYRSLSLEELEKLYYNSDFDAANEVGFRCTYGVKGYIKDPDLAMKIFNYCLDNNYYETYVFIAIWYEAQKKYKEALSWYNTALKYTKHKGQVNYIVGVLLFNLHKYDDAIRYLIEAEKNGWKDSYVYLYKFYYQQDESKYAHYLKLAYQNKDPDSSAKYAISLIKGDVKSIPQDVKLGMSILYEYAKKGNFLAQTCYGAYLISNLYGIEPNDNVGFNWLLKAKDHPDAHKKDNEYTYKFLNGYLGFSYYNGIGTSVDYQKALSCLMMSDYEVNPYSAFELARCYYEGYCMFPDYQMAYVYASKAKELAKTKPLDEETEALLKNIIRDSKSKIGL